MNASSRFIRMVTIAKTEQSIVSSVPQKLIRARLDRCDRELIFVWLDVAELLASLRNIRQCPIDFSESANREIYIVRHLSHAVDYSAPCDYSTLSRLSVCDSLLVLLRRLGTLKELVTSENHIVFWTPALEFVLWCDLIRTAAAAATNFACIALSEPDLTQRQSTFEYINDILFRTQRDYLVRELNMHVRIILCVLIG